jgi:hypothetical protein
MRTAVSASAMLLIALYSAAGRADLPQAFSADVVKRDSNGAAVGQPAKLRVWDSKTRLDTAEAAGGFFLTDASAATAWFVRFGQHVFMDAKQSTPLTRIFVRVDPHDPCRQWQAAALIAGIGGEATWRCGPIRDAAIIDPVLQFPIKWRSPDGGSLVLENIRVEAQPAELFAVPAGYQKLDPETLVERIKHSDVWAPAPEER